MVHEWVWFFWVTVLVLRYYGWGFMYYLVLGFWYIGLNSYRWVVVIHQGALGGIFTLLTTKVLIGELEACVL